MDPVSRRSFLSKGSLGAVAAVGLASAGPAAVAAVTAASSEAPLSGEELGAVDGPLVMHIRDAAAGEVEVMVGERSVVVQDSSLVAKLLRAAR